MRKRYLTPHSIGYLSLLRNYMLKRLTQLKTILKLKKQISDFNSLKTVVFLMMKLLRNIWIIRNKKRLIK